MIGHITWQSVGRFKVVEEEKKLHQLSILTLALEEKGRWLPYRLKQVRELFLERKIRTVITPLGFDHWHHLPQLKPYDPLPELQSLGGELALFHLKKRKIPLRTASVTLVGERVTKPLEQVAFTLAKEVGEVIIATDKGKQRLQERLFARYGLAPCDRREWSDAVIYFNAVTQKNRRNTTLKIQLEQENSVDFLPITLKNKCYLPHIPPLTQIALLLGTQRLSKKEIEFT